MYTSMMMMMMMSKMYCGFICGASHRIASVGDNNNRSVYTDHIETEYVKPNMRVYIRNKTSSCSLPLGLSGWLVHSPILG
jgi:hypothetical protein